MIKVQWRTKKNSGEMIFATYRAFTRMIGSFRDDVAWKTVPLS